MKTIFVPKADLDLKELSQKYKNQQVLVKVQAPDGKVLEMNLSPCGVSISVGEFRELCESSSNRELAKLKLESIEGLGDGVELAITVDQIQQLSRPVLAND